MAAITDVSIWGAALFAGILIVISHVAFGREVLRRGIIFIDLTLAQVAAVGVVIAAMLHFESPLAVQLAATSAALVAAAGLAITEQKLPQYQEAIIGSVYAVAASLVLILVANNPHGAEQLNTLLAGQILWLQFSQLWAPAILFAVILLLWWRLEQWRQQLFYPLFAIVVTTSVQLVGLYLVFASLILPALASITKPGFAGLLRGWLIGLGGYMLGIILSLQFDWPTGPAIVCALAAVALLAALLIAYRRPGDD